MTNETELTHFEITEGAAIHARGLETGIITVIFPCRDGAAIAVHLPDGPTFGCAVEGPVAVYLRARWPHMPDESLGGVWDMITSDEGWNPDANTRDADLSSVVNMLCKLPQVQNLNGEVEHV